MRGMSAATLVVYSGAYLFLVFFAVCLATGLYYLAELVEEYTRLTRRIINYSIKAVIAIHVLLLLFDRLPLLCIGCGILAHLLYYRLLKTFPYISLTSNEFLASVGLLVASHIAWFRFFMSDPRCAYLSVEWLLGFLLLMVWIVPFAFFISMAANESVLPGGAGYQGYSNLGVSLEGDGSHRSRRTQGQLLGFLNFLRHKRDEVLPLVAERLPSAQRVKPL